MKKHLNSKKANAAKPSSISRLEEIPNIGPQSARDLRLLGIHEPGDLLHQDGYELFERLCKKTKQKHDPCVIDVFLSAIHFMNGKGALPWWKFTQQRKQRLIDMQSKRGEI